MILCRVYEQSIQLGGIGPQRSSEVHRGLDKLKIRCSETTNQVNVGLVTILYLGLSEGHRIMDAEMHAKPIKSVMERGLATGGYRKIVLSLRPFGGLSLQNAIV